MEKVMICGSIDWTNESYILKIIKKLPKDVTVIHGNLEGVESIVHACCKFFNIKNKINTDFDLSYYTPLDLSARLMCICDAERPDKIIIIDNTYDDSMCEYSFLKYITTTKDIIVIKSVYYY